MKKENKERGIFFFNDLKKVLLHEINRAHSESKTGVKIQDSTKLSLPEIIEGYKAVVGFKLQTDKLEFEHNLKLIEEAKENTWWNDLYGGEDNVKM